jgi:type III pantothenate kinase
MRRERRGLVVFSVGNTSVRAARASSRGLGRSVAIPADAASLEARIDRLLRRWNPARAAACSVNPDVERVLARALRRRGIVLERVGVELRPPLRVRYRPRTSLGADRIAGVCGGLALAPRGCIVVDCGTAITVNVGLPSREFAGGAIAPGLGLASRALSNGTKLLPAVRPARPPRAPARSTRSGIALGVLAGTAGLVDRLVEVCARSLPREPEVFVTGGDARRLSPLLRTPHRVEPDLVLRGVLEATLAEKRWNSSRRS